MRNTFFIIFISFLFFKTQSQNVVMSDDNTYSSTSTNSLLETYSENGDKGILVPRMTSLQRIAISPHATNDKGLLVYDTDNKIFYYWDGTSWIGIGNKYTLVDGDGDTKVEVEESADENIIRFDVSGTEAMVINSDGKIGMGNGITAPNNYLEVKDLISFYNTKKWTCLGYQTGNTGVATGSAGSYIGYQAGASMTSGGNTSIIGTNAVATNTNQSCFSVVGAFAGKNATRAITAFGDSALFNTTQTDNVAFGSNALYINTTGGRNTAIGSNAMYGSSTGTGSDNTAIGKDAFKVSHNSQMTSTMGYQSLKNCTYGYRSCAFGYQAGYTTTSYSRNVALGYKVMYNATSSYNVALGYEALNYGSMYNVSIGSKASHSTNTSFQGTVAIGNEALYNNTASSTVAIGNRASYAASSNDRLSIGDSALFSSDAVGAFAIGESSAKSTTTKANFSIGYRSLYTNALGDQNTSIGYKSMYLNSSGDYNLAIGSNALNNITANNNIAVGHNADYYNVAGSNNTIIGFEAGKGSSTHSKSGNIFIGYQSGFSETGSNKLFIENSNSTSPLIYGDFNNDYIKVNGSTEINGKLVFTPSSDQALLTGDVLNVTSSIMRVVGNGGSVTLTTTPSVVGTYDGQEVKIQGTSNTNTITLQDESNLASSGLQLNGGTDITLGQGDFVCLIYDSGDSKWYEVMRSDN